MLLRPGLRAGRTLFSLHTSTISSTNSSSNILLRRLFHHPRQPASLSKTRTLRRASPSSHPLLLTTLAISSGILVPQYFFSYPTRNDTGSAAPFSHGRDAKTPLSTDGGKSLNPAAIRQISTGAILGLGLGVVFSALSRMLVLVLGIGIVVWQYAARKGYNFIPVDRLQRYVKGVNLRSAINDNAAFKISFGLMFALTAFGEF